MSLHCIQNEVLLQGGQNCKQLGIRNNFEVDSKGKRESSRQVCNRLKVSCLLVMNWVVTSKVVTPRSFDVLFMLRRWNSEVLV